MRYAIELNTRQSIRTLEQAIRHRAQVVLEPRIWEDAAGVRGSLVGANEDMIEIVVAESQAVDWETIVGMYCDTSLLLGTDRFMFSTNATDVEQQEDGWHVFLARPSKLQVYQRRRFWRVRFAESSPVDLRWGRDGAGSASGRLCNVSGEGLACIASAAALESASIGDPLAVTLALPECAKPFTLNAILCNKTPAAEPGDLLVSMQFVEPASSGKPGAAQELHAYLLDRQRSGELTEDLESDTVKLEVAAP
ncbi:MAG: PilZ domain-containing protein [Phycisphaerae bacterium]|nr:PilZ domain-containing protein [Phycisphaerae bacterium]